MLQAKRRVDSINKNQPEHNRADLTGAEAVEKIRSLIKSIPTCFFCTTSRGDETGGSRPMSVQQVDDEGNLWFLSAKDSHKNNEISADPNVELYFQGSSFSDFLHLSGIATISTDQSKIDELWEPIIKTWFTEGKDDPRITVIKIEPTHGYYWDNKHGDAIAGIKMLVGAAIGRTLDDSIEGTLAP